MTSRFTSQAGGSGHAPLKLTFHGGLYMGIPQEAIFTFHCNPTAPEPSVPVLTSHADPLEDKGKHKLDWTSHHACPIGGYPEPPTQDPLPSTPTPDRRPTSKTIPMGLMILVAVALVMLALKRLQRKFSKRDPNRYYPLALPHITPTLHYEADQRSPLSARTPDSCQAGKYTGTM
ncbi:hypothetical protein RhiJN_06542 [Ceratobasidium sp. AG-Ba]|nr:hypothetical protein RhiJN_06542 [Ceratobasidium sp. AG-Ba]